MGLEVDIRKSNSVKVGIVRVADKNVCGKIKADVIKPCDVGASMFDTGDGVAKMHIPTKNYALNLIKGIEKAIELGWVE
tara:strand:- start:11562 stop:11798 length:237 start_codon:yes stop_codon:yes gene_type:complete